MSIKICIQFSQIRVPPQNFGHCCRVSYAIEIENKAKNDTPYTQVIVIQMWSLS